MGERKDVWSTWYNTDRPWAGNGDYETVTRIENLYGKICRTGYTIVGAQCRDLDAHETFDWSSVDYSNYEFLETPCTVKGLECANNQQPVVGTTQRCHDYAVRFRCKYTNDDDNTLFPQFDVRIYIILAVFPILIFLVRILWAYVFRRRRQRRREARRAARLRGEQGDDIDDDDTSSVASGLANPPPSYHQIFGERGKEGVFAISRGNIPVCDKCARTPCSIAYILKMDTNRNQTRSGSSASTTSVPGQTGTQTLPPTPSSASSSQEQALSPGTSSPSDPTYAEHQPPTSDRPNREDGETQNASAERTGEATNPADVAGACAFSSSSSSSSSHRVSIDSVDEIGPHRKVCALASNATVETYVDARADGPHPGLLADSISEAGEVRSNSLSHESVHNSDSFHDIELEERSSSSSQAQELHHEDSHHIITELHHSSPTIAFSPPSSSSPPTINEPSMGPSNSPPLFSPLDSTTLDTSRISQPCACACHRTIPFEGRVVTEYDNAGFVADDGLDIAQANPRFPGMHTQVPGLHRVWSNASVGSAVTLSELPTYEDALELIKKKEAEAAEQGTTVQVE